MDKKIHPGNFECFMDVYREELLAAQASRPHEYSWTVVEFEKVYMRMRAAIERGSFDKDSSTFRRTCKRLGINHTYKAIKEFIG